MSRKERRTPRLERIRALIDAGNHAAAGAEARALVEDAGASEEERAAGAALLASLAPDRGVVAAGAVGVAIALVVALAVVLGA